MKRVILAATALVAIWATGSIAKAETIEDPLRGFCVGPPCTATGSQIIVNNIGTPGAIDGFGFNSSPDNTGQLSIVALVPSQTPNANLLNINLTGSGSASLLLDVNGFGAGITTFTAGVLQGSNPTLADFLVNGAKPDNNLNQYLGATNDPAIGGQVGTVGYDVYVATLPGLFSLTTNGSTDVFNIGDLCLCLPSGTFVVGFLNTNVLGGTQNGIIGTANSEALVTQFAVPGPIAGAGIPGLIALFGGAGGMLGFNRFRKKRQFA